MARSDKLVSILLVEGFALRLVVRTKRTPNDRSLVDIYAEPVQAIYKKIDCTLYCAGNIGILDAQDKCSSSMACIEPAKQCGAKTANMLKTGWAGSKTQAWCAPCDCCVLSLCKIINLCHKCENLLLSHIHRVFRIIVT